MTDDNRNLVKTCNLSWREIVERTAGKDFKEPEIVYVFSNGRKFESTDASSESGIYEND